MIAIPAKKARIFYISGTSIRNYYYKNKILFCFTAKEKDKVRDKYKFINFNIPILRDVTVNEEGRLHSYDDKPALVFNYNGDIVSVWAENGFFKREEKAAVVVSKKCYYIYDNDGFRKSITKHPKTGRKSIVAWRLENLFY